MKKRERMHIVRPVPPKLIVRKDLTFDFSDTPAIHTANNRYISHYLNAFSLVTPITEGILLRAAGRIRSLIKDPLLTEELRAFVTQEKMHTREHQKLNRRLTQLGYGAKELIDNIEASVKKMEEQMPLQDLVAACVVGEHAVYSVARTCLLNQNFLDRSHHEVRRLMLWHCLEEVEHQSTFSQFYEYLYPNKPEMRRRYSAQFARASGFVTSWASQIMLQLLKIEGLPSPAEILGFGRWAFLSPAILTGITREMFAILSPDFKHWGRARTDFESMDKAKRTIYAA
jgi:uncharacterized protein